MSSAEVVVSLDEEEKELVVEAWSGNEVTGGEGRYPYVWLRDCCLCTECFHPEVQARRMLFQDLDMYCKPRSAVFNAENDAMVIVWLDGHMSEFPRRWLLTRQFGLAVTPRRSCLKLWGSELSGSLPTIDFTRLLSDDRTLYDWITALQVTGLCVVTGTPQREGQVERIAERVCYLKPNHYGSTFKVTTKNSPSNLAYTTDSIGFHTDLAYLEYVPGMQMLHCISQVETEGGQNQLADGFHAAELLRQRHPHQFEILSTVVLDFFDIGNESFQFYQKARHRTIELDEDGNVVQITFSNHSRDSLQPRLCLRQVRPFYEALRTFYDLLYHKENIVEYKMRQGDILTFHNYRVLHARTGFSVAAGGERHLEGGYIDWDGLNSRQRILKKQLGVEDETDDH